MMVKTMFIHSKCYNSLIIVVSYILIGFFAATLKQKSLTKYLKSNSWNVSKVIHDGVLFEFLKNVKIKSLLCDSATILLYFPENPEKYPWRNITFSKVADFSLQRYWMYQSSVDVFQIVQMVLTRAKRLICF